MVLALMTVSLTAAYCFLILLGQGVYAILLPPEIARDLSLLGRVTLGLEIPFPWHALPWQLPAVLSMCWVLMGARSSHVSTTWPFDRRLLVHTALVLTLTCLAGVAMIMPLVSLVPVLKR